MIRSPRTNTVWRASRRSRSIGTTVTFTNAVTAPDVWALTDTAAPKIAIRTADRTPIFTGRCGGGVPGVCCSFDRGEDAVESMPLIVAVVGHYRLDCLRVKDVLQRIGVKQRPRRCIHRRG